MSNRQIRIIPSFTGYREGVICFETQCDPEEVRDLSKFAFEHHGDAFSPLDPGALRLFHERILLGQDMPSTLILTNWRRYDQVMATAIFTNPLIVLESSCTSLVNSFDLIDRLGPPAFSHIPHDHKELAYMVKNLTDSCGEGQVRSEKILEILQQCVSFIHRYVEDGALPPVEIPTPSYEIRATAGSFVAFEADDYVWDALWSQGYLWGIWARGTSCELRRKSQLISGVDLDRILKGLQDRWPSWEKTGPDTLAGEASLSELIAFLQG